MSEEYTQSKAYLDAQCRFEQLEPYPVTIARLTAERAKYEGMLKAAQQLLIARGNDLLAARSSNSALRDERDEARTELAKLKQSGATRIDVNYSPDHSKIESISLQRPVGRLEAVEAKVEEYAQAANDHCKRLDARIKAIESLFHAR